MRVAAAGDVLLDESFRQLDPFGHHESRIRAGLILRRALGIVVVDRDNGARVVKESGRTGDGIEALERFGDQIVGADVSHRSREDLACP